MDDPTVVAGHTAHMDEWRSRVPKHDPCDSPWPEFCVHGNHGHPTHGICLRVHWEKTLNVSRLRNLDFVVLLKLAGTYSRVPLEEIRRWGGGRSERTIKRYRGQMRELVTAGILAEVDPEVWDAGDRFTPGSSA